MLKTLEAPEIIFGLCSAVGTKNSKFVKMLESGLRTFKYNTEYFKVTTLMKNLDVVDLSLDDSSTEGRYDSYIKYANNIREKTGLDNALAVLGISAISAYRKRLEKNIYQIKLTYLTNLKDQKK
ncbi:hypothetical protein G3T14_08435 [Methylobacterium sp. BTF04]|uniref:hypothetical protein n=1 Tax=Methylobacterium sp. BTF04 TaxID=2708300 RepID=UPI0013D8228A|nr:hypothetical protein [Methylobacterium sp. BTF04]NEU12158.1 hypothetical protein [Methylobacterium sp. BTF04]